MFEKNRKFLKCIFCGSSEKLTSEHIFGKALAKKYPSLPNWKVPLNPIQQAISGKNVINGGTTILYIAPPLACKECNGGVLKSSEANNITLNLLASGSIFTFKTVKQPELRRFFERIGIIIDVCTSNLDVTAERKATVEYQLVKNKRQLPPVFTENDRKNWKNGQSLSNLQIYIGNHKGVLGLAPSPNTSPAITYDNLTKKISHSKTITFVLNKLAVCIIVGNQDIKPAASFIQMNQDLNVITWPLPNAVSYRDVFDLYAQDEEHLVRLTMLKILENETLRKEAEQYSISVKDFKLPPNHKPIFDNFLNDLKNSIHI